MLLRRFAKHFRDQDWLAVSLDFVVVVAGIYVALQASDWNEGRKARVAEARYLRQLHEDFGTARGYLDLRVDHEEQVVEGLTDVLEALERGSVPAEKRESFELGLARRFLSSSAFSFTGAISQLQSSGRLADIGDIELRNRLVMLSGAREYADEEIDFYRYLFTSLQSAAATHFTTTYDPQSNMPVVTDFDLESMRQDHDFRNEIVTLLEAHSSILQLNRLLIRRVESVEQRINELLPESSSG